MSFVRTSLNSCASTAPASSTTMTPTQRPEIIVACWEGQNPRLQAKASAFLATRLGRIVGGSGLYDSGASSLRLSPLHRVLFV